MGLKDVLTAINNELIANGTLPAASPVNYGASPRSLKTSPNADGTPSNGSVYWVPLTASGRPPNVAASRAVQDALKAANQPIPRTFHIRAAVVECHLWAGTASAGDDFAATENLLTAVVSALHHAVYGSYRYLGDAWVLHGTDAAMLGHRLIARFEIDVPLIELPMASPAGTQQVIQVTTITQTDQLGPIPPGGSTQSSTP